MLDLPLLDQGFLLILSLLLLDFEVLIDQVLLRHIGKLKLLDVKIVSAEMALLALETDGIPVVAFLVVSELDGIHTASHNASLVHRVAVLSAREKVCILLTDECFQTIFESTLDSCRQLPI